MRTITLFLIIVPTLVFSQIGIGTISPNSSSILDVQSTTSGVLFPRMTTVQRDLIPNPAIGLLIFNTDVSSFQYNFETPATPNWVNLSTNLLKTVKYTNANTTMNLGLAGVIIPIFGTLQFNDDTSLYNVINRRTIRIMQDGRYRLTTNLYVTSTDAVNIAINYLVNAVGQSSTSVFGTINTNNGGMPVGLTIDGSLHLTEMLNLNAGNQIQLESNAINTNASATTMTSIGTSNITIEKLD